MKQLVGVTNLLSSSCSDILSIILLYLVETARVEPDTSQVTAACQSEDPLNERQTTAGVTHVSLSEFPGKGGTALTEAQSLSQTPAWSFTCWCLTSFLGFRLTFLVLAQWPVFLVCS